MSFYLLKNKNGTFSPCDSDDYEAAKGIPAGSVVKATAPRNYLFHKKAFALLNCGYSNQDRYKSFDIYRKVKTMEAGYVDETFDKDGVVQLLPQSLSYDAMSSEKFEKWYNAVLDVISSDMDSKPEELRNEVDQFF